MGTGGMASQNDLKMFLSHHHKHLRKQQVVGGQILGPPLDCWPRTAFCGFLGESVGRGWQVLPPPCPMEPGGNQGFLGVEAGRCRPERHTHSLLKALLQAGAGLGQYPLCWGLVSACPVEADPLLLHQPPRCLLEVPAPSK